MLTCSTVRTKDSWLIIRFQTLWPKRVTMLWHLCQNTLSKPHQIQWVWIHFCCSSNSLLLGTDVLRYELCVYPPVLYEATGSMLQSDKPSQANTIQGWVHPSSTQFPQDVSYIYDGGAHIHFSISMVVVDGLLPFWCLVIHSYVGWTMHIRRVLIWYPSEWKVYNIFPLLNCNDQFDSYTAGVYTKFSGQLSDE